MKIKIEFGRSRSSSWAWVLRLCKQQPGYAVTKDDGVEIHSVKFNERSLRPALVMLSKLRSWRDVSVFIDGEITTLNEAWGRIYKVLRPRIEMDRALDQLSADLNTKLKDTGMRISLRHTGAPRRTGKDPELGF